MPVGEHLRPVPIEHEQVRVPTISNQQIRLLPQPLLDARKPAFGAFPRVEVAVELLRAVRPIVQRQGHLGLPNLRLRGDRKVPIVAVGHEPTGKIPRQS